jgi:CheY-like chemotaxis protein
VLSKAVEFSLEEERVLLNVSFNEGFLKVCLKNDSSETNSTETLHGAYPFNDPQGISQEDNSLDVPLALAQKLIQLHGGDIGLDYDEKGGSQLWFTLPKQQVTKPDAGDKKNKSPVQPGSRPLRILLVDDNDNIQNLVSDILLKEKYKVFVAGNGRTGLEMAKHCRPDLIFMDINMPVMDGTEAIQSLRSLPGLAKTPVVALSAYEKEDMGVEYYKLGFTHYLNKPFSKSDLMDAIHTYVTAE